MVVPVRVNNESPWWHSIDWYLHIPPRLVPSLVGSKTVIYVTKPLATYLFSLGSGINRPFLPDDDDGGEPVIDPDSSAGINESGTKVQ